MLSRLDTIADDAPPGRRFAAIVMVVGAYLLALSHVGFAFMYGYVVVLVGQPHALGLMAVWSAVLIMATVSAFLLFIRTPRST